MSLLCEIIAQGGQVASGFYSGDRDFAALVKHGFLRKAGVLASVVCDECDAPRSAPVVYEDSGYGYYCPDIGFMLLASTRLTTVIPDVPMLIRRLAETLVCRQRKSSCLHGQTWRIGAVPTPSAPVML